MEASRINTFKENCPAYLDDKVFARFHDIVTTRLVDASEEVRNIVRGDLNILDDLNEDFGGRKLTDEMVKGLIGLGCVGVGSILCREFCPLYSEKPKQSRGLFFKEMTYLKY